MQIILRDYQKKAVDHALADLNNGFKRILIEAPTGAGKSLIIAKLCELNIGRTLVLAHQSELLKQNESELNELIPNIKTGIFCAKVRRKDTSQKVIFASRDSLGNNPLSCGRFDQIIIDECHMLNLEGGKSKYQKILDSQGVDVPIIGLTASPYRKNTYIYGKEQFFEKRSYNIKIRDLIDKGYLSKYTFPEKRMDFIKADEIEVTKGDFNNEKLDAISSTEDTVKKCIDAWQEHSIGRKLSIFFCCSRNHAKVVEKELLKRNVRVGYVDGETETNERDKIIEGSKKGLYDALVNVNVLTTGVNIKIIDCVVMLRATKSVCIFIQAYGRGMRSTDLKENCLFLDMSENFKRFGGIENPRIKAKSVKKDDEEHKKIGSEEGKNKLCPICGMAHYPSTSICKKEDNGCGHIFFNHKSNITMRTEPKQKKWISPSMVILTKDYLTRTGKKCDKIDFVISKTFDKYTTLLWDKTDGAEYWQIKQSLSAREILRSSFKDKRTIKFGENSFSMPIEIEIETGFNADNFVKQIRKINLQGEI